MTAPGSWVPFRTLLKVTLYLLAIMTFSFLIHVSSRFPAAWQRLHSPNATEQGMWTVNSAGRLGNQMGEYATLYALAKMNGRQAYILPEMHQQLAPLFRITLPVLSRFRAWSILWKDYELHDWMSEEYRHIEGKYVRLTGHLLDVIPPPDVDAHVGHIPALPTQPGQVLVGLLLDVVVEGEFLEDLLPEVVVEGPGAGVAHQPDVFPLDVPVLLRHPVVELIVLPWDALDHVAGDHGQGDAEERRQLPVHLGEDVGLAPVHLGQGVEGGVFPHLVPQAPGGVHGPHALLRGEGRGPLHYIHGGEPLLCGGEPAAYVDEEGEGHDGQQADGHLEERPEGDPGARGSHGSQR
uniref:L-Fucosyltransferase n=1 Tax=Chrysemys picta bellii TaxID=8478 RepID=A0A8C3HN52_CHRPI